VAFWENLWIKMARKIEDYNLEVINPELAKQ